MKSKTEELKEEIEACRYRDDKGNKLLAEAELKGRQSLKKEVLEVIEGWRVQLETGFISMDKHFVEELKKEISKL